MLAIGLIGIAFSLGAVVWLVLSSANDRASVRASLRQLDGYEVDNMRDRSLLQPVGMRAIEPAVKQLIVIGKKITPSDYVAATERKLLLAGRFGALELDRYLAIRVATGALSPVVFLGIVIVEPFANPLNLLIAGFLGLLLLLGPEMVLDRRVRERQHEIRIRLPDVLDLLVISVEAGLGFEQALGRTVDSVPGALSVELRRMLGEIRAGASRADALRALDKRTDVFEIRSFVLALLQADAFGVSIGRVLRTQAEEMRIKRRQIAQEEAQKAPVKMLIPMVFCIFPSLIVVILGPAMLNILENLSFD